MKPRVYVCVRVGGWMFRQGHLYRWRPHQDARTGRTRWHDWDRVV